MSFFDDLLAKVSDDGDRAAIAKYPEVKKSIEDMAAVNDSNQAWLASNYDFEAKKTFREKTLEQALEEANGRAATAAAKGNSDMTFEEIEQNLKSKGYVSKADVEAQISLARSGVEQQLANRDLGSMVFTGHVANLTRKHHEEFGVDLDVNGFAKHIVESGAKDPVSAYDQYVASQRAAKTAKELETVKAQNATEMERVKAEAMEAGRKQALMEQAQNGGGGMPVDQGRGMSGLGWMQKRAMERSKHLDADGNQLVPEGKLGDGSATAAIMAQLAKDRAEGKVPLAIQ